MAAHLWGSRERLVLVVVCVAVVAWLVVSVEGIDRLVQEAGGSGQLGDRVVWLGVGGLVCWLLVGLGAWGAASVLTEGPRKLADRMELLASKVAAAKGEEPRLEARELQLPVDSADEIGDLATAFNRLIARVGEDQTALWRSAEEASRAEDRQVEFLATVSSSLRTPLHSINLP